MKTKLSLSKAASAILVISALTGFVWAQTAKPQPGAQAAPHKTNIAVINLKSSAGVGAGEAELISDRLRGELFNTGKVNVMERDQMQEILKEQGFQQSGACSNEACMVEIGQLLGVEQLITGSLGKVGSMFLVNLRIIDVKTAKITKVVSKDIKGSIEDVVGELGAIAAELAGTSPSNAVVEKREEEKPVAQPKPEPVSEQVTVKEERKEIPVPDERVDKNKNRFGISFGSRLYFGPTERIEHRTMTDSLYNTTRDTINYDSIVYNASGVYYKPKVTESILANFFFEAVLKAGPFMTINVGGGYASTQTEYEWDAPVNYKETHVTSIFSFPSVGINYVKRWFPLKLNVGAFFDLNFIDYSVAYGSRLYDFDPFVTDTTLDFFSVSGDFGVRVGVEILAGKHVGFNVDFVYCYSAFSTLPETRDFYNSFGYVSSSDEVTYDLRMPAIGLGFGVNFYF